MKIQKIKRRWYVDGKLVDHYQMFNIYGRLIGIMPSKFDAGMVADYIRARDAGELDPKIIIVGKLPE